MARVYASVYYGLDPQGEVNAMKPAIRLKT